MDEDQNLLKKYKDSMNLQKKINPRLSLKYKTIRFTFITYCIDTFLLGNRIIDNLPRWVVYPTIKNLLFVEYLIQCLFVENKKYPLFNKTKKVNRFVYQDGRSLRAVVKKSNESLMRMSEIERVRNLLSMGR
ncbi:MAG: hypothetical protein HQK65_22190 [Desulfamplus sp.]|nr:hypothetical protein [Desulfamplus sp.]